MYFDKTNETPAFTKCHIVSAASSKTAVVTNLTIKRMLENEIHTSRFVCFDIRNGRQVGTEIWSILIQFDLTAIEKAEMKLGDSGCRAKLGRGALEGLFPFPFLSRFVLPSIFFFVPLSLRPSLKWRAYTILALRVHPNLDTLKVWTNHLIKQDYLSMMKSNFVS